MNGPFTRDVSKMDSVAKAVVKMRQIDEVHAPGTKVYVPHKGKTVSGKVVRHDKGDKHGSPFYVVDVGEYESAKVPAHKVSKYSRSWYTGNPHKEETEQLDELSSPTLKRYVKAAGDEAKRNLTRSDLGVGGKNVFLQKALKREKGIDTANVKIQKKAFARGGPYKSPPPRAWEETEQLNELGKKTLKSYKKQALGRDYDRLQRARDSAFIGGNTKAVADVDRKMKNRYFGHKRATAKLKAMEKPKDPRGSKPLEMRESTESKEDADREGYNLGHKHKTYSRDWHNPYVTGSARWAMVRGYERAWEHKRQRGDRKPAVPKGYEKK